MGKVIYLGHFGNSKNNRFVYLPAQTMVRYMHRAINDTSHYVTMISLAQPLKPCERAEQILDENTKAIFVKGFKIYKKNLLMRAITKVRKDIEFEKELDNLIEDGDVLIAYHSLTTVKLINKLRKKKKFTLILQVCEVYADVLEDKKLRKKEIEFIRSADKYILISDFMKKEIGLEDRECAVCSGSYEVKERISEPADDGKIHVVYAGTPDEKKGGAYFAISSSKYLNEKYHIHILAPTTDEQKVKLKDAIENAKKETKCEITYDGCLGGKKYMEFLQSCHIGLSTQNPEGAYNATSFPSKILVYLSNGLNVVSVKIPPIENSPVGSAMHFYENPTDKNIADAILSVDINNGIDTRQIVNKLHNEFVKDLKNLIEN